MVRSIFKLTFVLVSVMFFAEASFALPSKETRAVIIEPFPYAEGAAPQNIIDEMDIENELPKLTFEYFNKIKAFKSIALVDTTSEFDADIYIKGEIMHTSGGSGAARYFGGLAGAGRSSLIVGIKVYDKDNNLIHEGVVNQNGARGGSIFSVWSNKKNITSAMNAIPKKIFLSTVAGDITTPEGIVRALQSKDPIAIQAGAKSASKHELYLKKTVTDSMEMVLLESLTVNTKNRYYIDGVAWCAINLGDSSDKKYIPTLESVLASEVNKKIKKHAKKALKKLNKLKA
ncbi:hypothetical protein [Pseudoalteromonas obscura]|uniref:Curli production assembly/transport component CsgG n=1 Tax=Pseudoalteromonas obscura TaxID=3048491 RepID=A0ABT7EP87_9GAMM|nr:hypothetical protein [Pseudoalteromonas sp. P94(2023)]MDK2596854.1 hypothetical protein [Pseudoalteromonas sp. P94(2023)]